MATEAQIHKDFQARMERDLAELLPELEAYNKLKPSLLAQRGMFALVKNKQLIGVFPTAEAAYVEGVKKFGNVPMLIVQIMDQEPIHKQPSLVVGLRSASP